MCVYLSICYSSQLAATLRFRQPARPDASRNRHYLEYKWVRSPSKPFCFLGVGWQRPADWTGLEADEIPLP